MRIIRLGLIAAVLSAASVAAWAQQVKVSGVAGFAQYRRAGSGKWLRARLGTTLAAGDVIRTGRRSIVELTFPDGSTYRLGPRSSLRIQAPARGEVKLGRGAVFVRIVKGSASRLVGRYGTVAVRGTKVNYQLYGRGEYVRVWDGAADYQSAQLATHLPPNTGTWLEDGSVAEACPIEPERFGDASDFPWWRRVLSGVEIDAGVATPFYARFRRELGAQQEAMRAWQPGRSLYAGPSTGQIVVELQQAPAAAGTSSFNFAPLVGLGLWGQARSDLYKPGRRFGKNLWGPYPAVRAYGLWGETASFLGGMGRLSAIAGTTFLQVSGRIETATGDDCDWLLDETYLALRSTRWDALAGRHRILEGPVFNSDVGTLLPFSLIDGATVHFAPTPKWALTGSWLGDYDSVTDYDAQGWYGRVCRYAWGGFVALAAAHENGVGTGVSAQFALPLVRDCIDVYGELGDDPAGRHIETFGINFPGLYQRYGLDIYFERAQRSGLDTLTTFHAFWELAEDKALVFALDNSRLQGWRVGIGFIGNFRGLR